MALVVIPDKIDDGKADAYGLKCLDWKSRGGSDFGVLTRSTEKYYEAELKRAGVLGKRDLNVLEVGFGNGDFVTYCKRRGWSVTGTEINPQMVAVAMSAGFDARAASGFDGLEADSFDLVVTIDVLKHIPPEETVSFLQRCLRLLRPGGVLVAHFPNADSPFGLYNQNGDITHVNAIGTGKAGYYAQAAGADLIFLHGEARPVPAGSLAHTGPRVIACHSAGRPIHWRVRLSPRHKYRFRSNSFDDDPQKARSISTNTRGNSDGRYRNSVVLVRPAARRAMIESDSIG